MLTLDATRQLRALLGADATDATTWNELQRFCAAALPIIEAIWQLNQTPEQPPWRLLHPATDAERALLVERRTEALRQIRTTLGDDTGACAAACFLHPQLWEPFYRERGAHQQYSGWQVHVALLNQTAEACALRHPPPDWMTRLGRRVITLCLAAAPGRAPDLVRCFDLLLDAEDARVTPLIDALSAGEWRIAAGALTAIARAGTQDGLADALQHGWAACHPLVERLLQRLAQTQRLDHAAFRQLLRIMPDGLATLNHTLRIRLTAEIAPDAEQQRWNTLLLNLTDLLLWELVSDLRPETWAAFDRLRFLSGGRYLLRIAEEVDRQGLESLPRSPFGTKRLDGLLVRLLQCLHRRHDDDSAALTGLLTQISPPALLAVLPHTPAYESEICAALGWAGAAELLQWLRRYEAQRPAQSVDPRAGVVMRSEVVQLTQRMDEAQLRQLLDTCVTTMRDAVLVVRATLGWNTAEIRRMLGRRRRMAVLALPLLPMTGPDDVLQRYLVLARIQREAQSSSPGRKPYERATTTAALATLAAAAGYSDATRLEWAMQARLGAEQTAIGRSWTIEGYMVTLALGDRGPALAVQNAKRTLKRFPSIVTRDYAYREVRATLEQAQDQDRRVRQALLDAMRHSSPLHPDELALLRANPIAARQLARLVLIDTAGAHGLFCPDDGALEGPRGERVPISGAVTVAHPFVLAEQGLLPDWQAELVRRQMVQPFKQVFRELYLLTPAEQEAGVASTRLAGRRMRLQQAMAVLASMGWLNEGGEVRKPFYQLGFAAHLTFDSREDDDDDGSLCVGALSFWPLIRDRRATQAIPLDAVPPVIFSEVVRDLDVVTVIAHQSEERGTSREILQRRGDLVRATAQALGLEHVQVEEPFATIAGQLGSYRIQLTTGAVYLKSGQYLCIVPKPARQQPIYLPFAEGGDPVTTEVISKVLLLANDQAIRDQTILAQIAPQLQAA